MVEMRAGVFILPIGAKQAKLYLNGHWWAIAGQICVKSTYLSKFDNALKIYD